MKIDDRVEPPVRSALDAAVHRDVSKFEAALRAFDDERALAGAVELVLAVCASVLFEVHDGMPCDRQVSELVVEMGQQEQWASISTQDVEALLAVVVRGDPARLAARPGNPAVIACVVAANLLATASQPDEGEWWFNYLDKVEAAIEAAG